MPTIVKNDGDLTSSLNITISVDDYKKEFIDKLKELRKDAHLKGFRKGKVPTSAIRKLYGKRVLADLIYNKLRQSIADYLEENDVKILAEPLPAEGEEVVQFNVKDLQDYYFEYEIAPKPEFEIKGVDDTRYDWHDVQIEEEKVEEEWQKMLLRYGEEVSVEDEIMEKDVITLQIEEMEEDEIKEGGWSNEFKISEDEISEKYQEIFRKSKAGDSVVIDNIFELSEGKTEDFVRKYYLEINEEEAEINNRFQAYVKEVTRVVPPIPDEELFDELFGEDEVTDEAEAREKVRQQLKSYYDRQANIILFNKMYETIMEVNDPPLPEKFLKRWLKEVNKGKDIDLIDYKPAIVWSMIRDRLAERFNQYVTEQEIRRYFIQQAQSYMGGYYIPEVITNYANAMMKNQREVSSAADQLKVDKLVPELQKVADKNIIEISSADFDKLMEEIRKEREEKEAAKQEQAKQSEESEGLEDLPNSESEEIEKENEEDNIEEAELLEEEEE